MTGEWTIRAMTSGDIPAVMGIADSLPNAPRWSRSSYENALNPAGLPPRIALVAELPTGSLAGFAMVTLALMEAELESVAVVGAWQRRGIARSLIRNLAGQLHSRNVDKVFLEVRASNEPARNLYTSLGFQETGRRRAYYSSPSEDALVLSLALRQPGPPE